MPSRSKIAPELGKTAVQNSRVERREICSDMGIHAREPITNQLNGKGQNADSPGHSFFMEKISHGDVLQGSCKGREALVPSRAAIRRRTRKEISRDLNKIHGELGMETLVPGSAAIRRHRRKDMHHGLNKSRNLGMKASWPSYITSIRSTAEASSESLLHRSSRN